MNEQRYIRWKTTPIEGGLFALQIVAQSHRDFIWCSSNKLLVQSCYGAPTFTTASIVVWGTKPKCDNTPIILTTDQLETCERALTEYNFAHSEYSDEWEIVTDPEGTEMFFVDGKTTSCVSYNEKNFALRIRRKKSDEDKAREAFLASEYAKDWDIVGWGKTKKNEFHYSEKCWVSRSEGTEGDSLVVRPKQPPVPTGEACVGCLCYVWDDGQRDRREQIVYSHNAQDRNYPYYTAYNKWTHAVPLTPEEVEVYYNKAKEAWRK